MPFDAGVVDGKQSTPRRAPCICHNYYETRPQRGRRLDFLIEFWAPSRPAERILLELPAALERFVNAFSSFGVDHQSHLAREAERIVDVPFVWPAPFFAWARNAYEGCAWYTAFRPRQGSANL